MATLSTAQQLRLRIQDIPTLADRAFAGDGTATTFLLPARNLTSASAFVPSPGLSAWTPTGATFDPTGGAVAFTTVIPAASAFRLTYIHSTFSDDEIDTFLTAGGNVNGAALEAVQALMFDGLRRARWAAPNGQSYDDTAAIGLLKTLYDTLKAEQAQAAVAEGGFAAWGLNQESY